MGRAPRASISDRRLPRIDYVPRRSPAQPPSQESPPFAIAGGGVAPTLDGDSLSLEEASESPFTHTIDTLSGTEPYFFFANELPDGVSLDPITGELYGSVVTADTYEFPVYVISAYGSDTDTFTLEIS